MANQELRRVVLDEGEMLVLAYYFPLKLSLFRGMACAELSFLKFPRPDDISRAGYTAA